MPIVQRSYTGAQDLARMIELAHVQPHDNVHVVDLPYRLSSSSLDDPANAAFWHDEAGRQVAWAVMQLRTLQQPDYRPELDLVAVDPSGQLVAFCIGWFSAAGLDGLPTGQIEPMGVRSDLRRYGLGRSLLAEVISRLHRLGAAQILVETDNYRDAAYALYTGMGFAVREDVLVYRKDYAPQ